MSSTDELREVEVQIKGNEFEAQHGHQMSMGDRDPTSMNDHVKVRRKAGMLMYIYILFINFWETQVKELEKKSTLIGANPSQMIQRYGNNRSIAFLWIEWSRYDFFYRRLNKFSLLFIRLGGSLNIDNALSVRFDE